MQVPALAQLPQLTNGPSSGGRGGAGGTYDGAKVRVVDGWGAQDSDTRVWKSLLTHAYDDHGGEGGKKPVGHITTAREEIIKRDNTMYENTSGYLDKKKGR